MIVRRLLMVLLLTLGNMSWAQTACELEESLEALLNTISHYDPYKNTGRRDLIELEVAVAVLNRGGMAEWVSMPERAGLASEIEALIAASEHAVADKTTQSLVVLQAHVRRFDVRYAAICGVPSNAAATSNEKTPGQLTSQQAPPDGKKKEKKPFEPSDIIDENADFSLLLTGLILMVALGGMWWLGYVALQWGKALFYRRQGCRIHADLFINDDLIEGYVVILGRKGCMFETLDRWAHEKMERLAEDGKSRLRIDESEIPCLITRIDDLGAGIKFHDDISVAQQKQMLQASTLTPFLIHILPTGSSGKMPFGRRILVKIGLGFLLPGGGQDSDGIAGASRAAEMSVPMEEPDAIKRALNTEAAAGSVGSGDDEHDEEANAAAEEGEDAEEGAEDEQNNDVKLVAPEDEESIGRSADGEEDVFPEEMLKSPPVFMRQPVNAPPETGSEPGSPSGAG